LDTRQWPELASQLIEVWAADRPRRQPRLPNDVGDSPIGKQFPVGDIGESMAAFGFIHVMGRDEKCEPIGSQFMNLFPELPSRFGIDPRCRLIE
jgi:hypothetical protein